MYKTEDKDSDHVYGERYEEHEEVSVVPPSYAVVDPGTMMVEPVDAHATQIAVSAPGRANDFALRAEAARFERVEELGEIQGRVRLELAWIGEPDPDPEDHGEAEQALAE